VAVLAVALSLRLGTWVGALGASTVRAAVIALLTVLVLPPLAVVGAERWLRRREGARSTRTGAALGAALGLQVLMLGGAMGAGASARRFTDAAMLTGVEAVVLSSVVRRVARRAQA
jgi:hypothetical protein